MGTSIQSYTRKVKDLYIFKKQHIHECTFDPHLYGEIQVPEYIVQSRSIFGTIVQGSGLYRCMTLYQQTEKIPAFASSLHSKSQWFSAIPLRCRADLCTCIFTAIIGRPPFSFFLTSNSLKLLTPRCFSFKHCTKFL
jgi:hypothetical protein